MLTKVINGEETLTLLKAWKKGVVIKVRGRFSNFRVDCMSCGRKTLIYPKVFILALWLQFVSVLQQVSEVAFLDYQTAPGVLRGHDFETCIADMVGL